MWSWRGLCERGSARSVFLKRALVRGREGWGDLETFDVLRRLGEEGGGAEEGGSRRGWEPPLPLMIRRESNGWRKGAAEETLLPTLQEGLQIGPCINM